MPRMTSAELSLYEIRRAPKPKPGADGHEGRESELHEFTRDRLRVLGWYHVTSSMAHRTHATVGAPDFIIAGPGGRTLWLELKTRTGKLRPEQIGTMAWLRKLGHHYAVCRSKDEICTVLRSLTPDET